MNIIIKKTSELKEYEKNPRKNDDAVKYVANSIKEFGFRQPIIIDKNSVIVCGHTRLKAAKKLGIKEVPCIMADDLSDEQIKAYRLADNKVAEMADWDLDLLDEELEDLFDFDMELFGFDEIEEEHEAQEDDFDVEEELEKVETITKLGDIWQLGRHRVMCGDSTDRESVAKLMNGDRADISFTSPPYNASMTPTEAKIGRDSKYANDDDNKTSEDYRAFLRHFTSNALEHSQYTFVNVQSLTNNKLALIDYLYDMKEFYADTIVWDKMLSQPAMAENVLNSEFEYVHIFSDKANRVIGTKRFRGTEKNIVHIQKQTRNEYSGIHNATFPIEFAAHFIKAFSEYSVLDLFGGTGTTLIACEQLERTCYMMELDPRYVDVIVKRWETLTGQKAVLLSDKSRKRTR